MIIYIKQANSQYINDTQDAAVFGAPHRKGTDEGKQRRERYRFKELAASEFPYQVKLFSRNLGLVKLVLHSDG